jgi:aminoglycoside phosphotransferase (APT) family kinase protein
MRVVDKADITPELVSSLVAAQFPRWAHLPITPVTLDGWDNRTFRLGDRLSVRLPSADAYAPQVEKEQRWLPVLAPHVPLPIPEPVATGLPGPEFPRPWSVYRWLPGEPATVDRIDDLSRFADDLSAFLRALYEIDPAGGPAAGSHSFCRGGPVSTWDRETRDAISALDTEIDAVAATEVWEAALAAKWQGPPVWVHGDVTGSNLLVLDGRLGGVVDFGCSAVGDPACDLTIAWTLFSGGSRDVFRSRLPLDDGTWARARGWALWKGLITLLPGGAQADDAARRFGWRLGARGIVEEVLAAPW